MVIAIWHCRERTDLPGTVVAGRLANLHRIVVDSACSLNCNLDVAQNFLAAPKD